VEIDVRISIATEGQMVGYEDVVNQRNYTTTCKCVSNEGTLFKMPREVFKEFMTCDERNWEVVKKLA
jgi:CRP-like cAMP-binding protein